LVDVETTDKLLSQYHSNYKQLRQHIWKSPGFDSGCWKIVKKRHTDRYTRCQELWIWKPQFTRNSFFTHCGSQFLQSFMVYTAVDQQQQNGYGALLAYCRMGCVILLGGILAGVFPWPFT
jgi:hypothetical protein